MAKLENFKPKNDLIFKKILEEKSRLKAFIADSLGIERQSVKNVEIMNTEVLPNELTSKFCRLDVKAKVDDKLVNIEIQRTNRNDFQKRVLYYWARMYSSSLNQGDEYVELPQGIIISIIDYNMFDCPEFCSRFILKEYIRNEEHPYSLELYYFELKKIPKETSDDKIVNWLKFFGAESDEDIQALTLVEDGELNSAINEFKRLSKDEKFVKEVMKREEIFMDERLALTAERKVGIEEGIQKGIEQGAEAKAIETATELLKINMNVEQISQVTKLSIEKILEIQKSMK
jgi:predicted transposase/invertase (TIGR01784 family)